MQIKISQNLFSKRGFTGGEAESWNCNHLPALNSCLCRMSEQGQTELQDLPPDLIDTVMKEIQGVCGFKGLASCRLVSKAWLAAVQQYPGKAGCTANADNMEALCQILPNMASVAVSSDAESATFNLRPLQSCSQLTSIELLTTATSFRYYTILDLPSTVKEAEVRNIDVDYNSLANSTSFLTRLQYQLGGHMFIESSQPDPGGIPMDFAWEWVKKWEYLKVGKPLFHHLLFATCFLHTFAHLVDQSKAVANHK